MISKYFYRRVARPSHIRRIIPYFRNQDFTLNDLSKKIGITYAYARIICNDAVSEGFLKREDKNNKTQHYNLTKKGNDLLKTLEMVRMVIEDEKDFEEIKDSLTKKIETKRVGMDNKKDNNNNNQVIKKQGE